MAEPMCGSCGLGDEVQAVPVETPAGCVEFLLCARCDRLACPDCRRVDMSGRAHYCRGCSTDISLSARQ